MTNELPKELIERALALTGKDIIDMNILPVLCRFSIQNFFYYLLSPEFIEKYSEGVSKPFSYNGNRIREGITEYQYGNFEPIISLLSKIGHQNK